MPSGNYPPFLDKAETKKHPAAGLSKNKYDAKGNLRPPRKSRSKLGDDKGKTKKGTERKRAPKQASALTHRSFTEEQKQQHSETLKQSLAEKRAFIQQGHQDAVSSFFSEIAFGSKKMGEAVKSTANIQPPHLKKKTDNFLALPQMRQKSYMPKVHQYKAPITESIYDDKGKAPAPKGLFKHIEENPIDSGGQVQQFGDDWYLQTAIPGQAGARGTQVFKYVGSEPMSEDIVDNPQVWEKQYYYPKEIFSGIMKGAQPKREKITDTPITAEDLDERYGVVAERTDIFGTKMAREHQSLLNLSMRMGEVIKKGEDYFDRKREMVDITEAPLDLRKGKRQMRGDLTQDERYEARIRTKYETSKQRRNKEYTDMMRKDYDEDYEAEPSDVPVFDKYTRDELYKEQGVAKLHPDYIHRYIKGETPVPIGREDMKELYKYDNPYVAIEGEKPMPFIDSRGTRGQAKDKEFGEDFDFSRLVSQPLTAEEMKQLGVPLSEDQLRLVPPSIKVIEDEPSEAPKPKKVKKKKLRITEPTPTATPIPAISVSEEVSTETADHSSISSEDLIADSGSGWEKGYYPKYAYSSGESIFESLEEAQAVASADKKIKGIVREQFTGGKYKGKVMYSVRKGSNLTQSPKFATKKEIAMAVNR